MQRRTFIQSSMLASTLPLASVATNEEPHTSNEEKELYELRTYEMRFRGSTKLLTDFLKNTLQVAMKRIGVNHFHLFTELGMTTPSKIWVLISYPDAATYIKAQNLQADEEFVKAAAEYNAIAPEQQVYNRFTSTLLLAFDGMPQMKSPIEDAGLFELRIYEGHSEDAVRRKVKMFNVEEIELFLKVGLHPVFFGDIIAGPHRPALTYMLNFKDMEERDANWEQFLQHPDWNSMKAKEEYANTVSNIRRVFLEPM
ncbi:MAG: NIPSNAP family protein [Bacteroidota bacterium]